MDKYDDRLELDVFKCKTTYQNDYKQYEIKPAKPSALQAVEKVKKKPKEYVIQDHQTYAMWRPNVYVPFDLLWRPKEITNSNPYKPFVMPEISESDYKHEAVKNKPRIYMSPAVSIDDIEDPETHKLLTDYMYTTECQKATRESAPPAAKRHIPNSTAERDPDPLRLTMDLFPPLPENFRNKGKAWEMEQFKMTIDTTKTFWEHKDPPVKCGACHDPIEGLVSEETKEEIRNLMSKNKLRMVHDTPMPGYSGYTPRFTGGIPLAKVSLPVVHPYMSVSQAITKRYADD